MQRELGGVSGLRGSSLTGYGKAWAGLEVEAEVSTGSQTMLVTMGPLCSQYLGITQMTAPRTGSTHKPEHGEK